MKKIAIILAIALLIAVFASCGKEETPATTTAADKPINTTAENKTTDAPKNTTAAPAVTEEPKPSVIPDFADASKFTVDGDLSEWTEEYHTISIIGDPEDTINNSVNKKAIFYAALTADGLYLACDAYHDMLTSGQANWWLNTNFEFFIGNIYISTPKQYYVFATADGCGKSDNVTEAIMVTEDGIDGTTYHTVVECFVEAGYLDDFYQNTINIGVAWKTAGDNIKGGYCNANPDKSDEYWVPKEAGWPADARLVCSPVGLYVEDDYPFYDE